MTHEDEYFEQSESNGAAANAEIEAEQYHDHQFFIAKEVFSIGINKNDISIIANDIVENILEKGNPLDTVESIKILEEIIDEVKKDIRFKNYALQELAKYNKNYVSARGVKIEPMESGTKYYYDKCNDPVMTELLTQQQTLTDKVKEREKLLKSIPKSGLQQVDRETGEEYLIYPPAKTSTTTYKVTFQRV